MLTSSFLRVCVRRSSAATPDRANKAACRYYESVKVYNASLYSQRCELRYKFSAAEEYVGKKIYYPYFLDFRGRAYPIPPYLNHTGGDLSRGLLRFYDARPLGDRGLFWLMVHTATLFGGGVDKENYLKREQWCVKHVLQMAKSVVAPLDDRWWLTADKPFQFLAAASELYHALRAPDPTKFMSHLPVHTDGSCNGLQHYAALGRDKWGGTCVNLVAADKPQDVYARVLDTVVVKLQADASNPSAAKQSIAQKLLTLKLNRKIVKQAVMTSVYGVTMIGARDQILARLQELPEAVALFDNEGKEGLHAVSMYLAGLTLSSLYDAFAGARRIQNWLGDCATRMSQVQQPVSWMSPLGLPIIQPYRAAQMHTVTTTLQRVSLASHSDHLPVSGVRQKSAFPPNFIHSLDATHMMMTASNCKARGLTFASVHDSYWTHAGSMDQLATALREEFVNLYEQPILEQTRDMWVRRYPEIPFPPVPQVGDLDIKEVLKSPYFFN
jgi:DNA-directed RNA polymerase